MILVTMDDYILMPMAQKELVHEWMEQHAHPVPLWATYSYAVIGEGCVRIWYYVWEPDPNRHDGRKFMTEMGPTGKQLITATADIYSKVLPPLPDRLIERKDDGIQG